VWVRAFSFALALEQGMGVSPNGDINPKALNQGMMQKLMRAMPPAVCVPPGVLHVLREGVERTYDANGKANIANEEVNRVALVPFSRGSAKSTRGELPRWHCDFPPPPHHPLSRMGVAEATA